MLFNRTRLGNPLDFTRGEKQIGLFKYKHKLMELLILDNTLYSDKYDTIMQYQYQIKNRDNNWKLWSIWTIQDTIIEPIQITGNEWYNRKYNESYENRTGE